MSARAETDALMLDEAIVWQQTLARDDADWAGFTTWLEADPRHRAAFDEIALLDRIIDERADDLRSIVIPADDLPAALPGRRTWRRRLIGSIAVAAAAAAAAAIAVTVGVPMLQPGAADGVYTTGVGRTRQVSLGHGTAVDLAPSSQLVAIAGDATRLRLDRGEAYFAVAHDPGRTLSIQAGNYSVTDIGTRFAVNLAPAIVTVAVAEGNVSVAADGGGATRLSGGQQLLARRDASSGKIVTIAADSVGSWRRGRLIYNEAPLSVVAADLARYSGKTVTVDPGIQDLQFSGVLTVGDGSRLFDNLSDLLAITYTAEGDRVRLAAAAAR